eukprot:6248675-Amphidinium_carterae.1
MVKVIQGALHNLLFDAHVKGLQGMSALQQTLRALLPANANLRHKIRSTLANALTCSFNARTVARAFQHSSTGVVASAHLWHPRRLSLR